MTVELCRGRSGTDVVFCSPLPSDMRLFVPMSLAIGLMLMVAVVRLDAFEYLKIDGFLPGGTFYPCIVCPCKYMQLVSRCGFPIESD